MTYNIGIFLFNDAELMDFAGPYEVFSSTYEICDHRPYHVFSIAETKDPITTVNGMAVVPEYAFSDHPPVDILVLPGGIGSRKEMEKVRMATAKATARTDNKDRRLLRPIFLQAIWTKFVMKLE